MDAVNTTVGPNERSRSGAQADGIDAVGRMLMEIEALAPEIASRASEAEAARRIPADVREKLKSLGVFRMTVFRTNGGLELEFPAVSRITQRLARIDGSVGWISAIAGGFPIVAPSLRRECYDEIYRHGPDVTFSGANQPAGTAEAVSGGWRINGRWPLCSGCQDASWIAVHCVLTRDGQPLPGPVEGAPATRFVVLPARHVEIEDTWHSLGLKATGSHHIVIKDMVVPDENLLDLVTAKPLVPGPLYGAPMQLLTMLHGSIVLGIAEGALDDIVAMAQSGRRQFMAATTMLDSQIFQYELGRAQANLRGAQAMQEVQMASHWQDAIAGTLRTEAKFVEATQSAIWATQVCLDVVQTCFALGGGSAVFASAPLQRRLRDLESAAQHAGVQQRLYAQSGKLLLNSPKASHAAGQRANE